MTFYRIFLSTKISKYSVNLTFLTKNLDRNEQYLRYQTMIQVGNNLRQNPTISQEEESKFQQGKNEDLPDELKALVQNVNLGSRPTQVTYFLQKYKKKKKSKLSCYCFCFIKIQFSKITHKGEKNK